MLAERAGRHAGDFFDLRADISESNDLDAAMPEKTRELRERLHGWLKSVDAKFPLPNPAYQPVACAQV